MATFPVPAWTRESFHCAPRSFGARRGGTRLHAGCDLYAPEHSVVKAIAVGKVLQVSGNFYAGAGAIAVVHGRWGLIRYCEIEVDRALAVGSVVDEGQTLGTVKRLLINGRPYKHTMLHLEAYRGAAAGKLTQPGHGKYSRRSDLVDPTPMLSMLAVFQDLTQFPYGAASG